jgi:hypothetical protein
MIDVTKKVSFQTEISNLDVGFEASFIDGDIDWVSGSFIGTPISIRYAIFKNQDITIKLYSGYVPSLKYWGSKEIKHFQGAVFDGVELSLKKYFFELRINGTTTDLGKAHTAFSNLGLYFLTAYIGYKF